ncbi:MAG: tripartite ATP-independent periplasmic transporter DctQ [Proteobacteria bacterium]|nr:tripartite ATP-independent periplasmic transporter DctQ [Pseudomonadota bacterium]
MKVLDKLEEWIITLLIGAATLITFFAVVHRYTSGYAIPGVQDWLLAMDVSWAQELTIIMFVWMAKFGAAYGVRTGIHVGVDVLINRLSDTNRFRFIVFGLLAGATFTGIVASMGGHFVWENGAHHAFYKLFGLALDDVMEGPTTPDLELPTWIVYSAIPLGSSLMCFRFLQVCFSFVRTGELPHHDHGHVDGLDEEPGDVEVNEFDLDDNLHPLDLKHNVIGEDRRGHDQPVAVDRRKDDLGGEPK